MLISSPPFLWALLSAVTVFSTGLPATSQPKARPFLHPLFTNHMVLQRDVADPVWGWTTPGANVTVKVSDQNGAVIQTKMAAAAPDGRWQVTVGPFHVVPSNAAYSMSVSGPDVPIATLADVLIGDVWLCAGQSNMEYTLYGNYPPDSGGTHMANAPAEIADAAAHYPSIRQFKARRGTSAQTPRDVFIGGVDDGGWTTTAQHASAFTAVGYFMAKQIYDTAHVPIGLLNITWGGTDILPWVAPETLRTIPDYAPALNGPPGGQPNQIYNALVAPAEPFGIAGAVWLQGESSADSKSEQQYGALLAALRDGLRLKFQRPKLPFIVVEISTGDKAQTVPVEETTGPGWHYAEIRDAQLNTALIDAASRVVVSIDCGYVPPPNVGTTFAAEVHNVNKKAMGLRAGQAALNLVYGRPEAPLSPTFARAMPAGQAIRCYFKNTGAGLMVGMMPQGLNQGAPPAPSPVHQVKGGTLTAFAIAGADHVWHFAEAAIEPATNTVLVSSRDVPRPVAVRYGWGSNPWNTQTNTPLCNLYRKVMDRTGQVVDGAPVSPFRTDPIPPDSHKRLDGGSATGTVSAVDSGLEGPAQAFDGNPTTKWFTTTVPSDDAPVVLQYQFSGGAVWAVTQYQITSANDMPDRDPKDWQFQGSTDGQTWTTQDTRHGEVFPGRGLTKTYTTHDTMPHRFYRLSITTALGGGSDGIQLAEFTLFSGPSGSGSEKARSRGSDSSFALLAVAAGRQDVVK